MRCEHQLSWKYCWLFGPLTYVICLQAMDMLDMTMVNSALIFPACSCCNSQLVDLETARLLGFHLRCGPSCGALDTAQAGVTLYNCVVRKT